MIRPWPLMMKKKHLFYPNRRGKGLPGVYETYLYRNKNVNKKIVVISQLTL